MTVTLVTFEFCDDQYVAPAAATIDAPSLIEHLARVRDGHAPRFDWPWSTPSIPHHDPIEWLRENTRGDTFSLVIEPTLAQCVQWTPRSVIGRYVFDDEYARAHPEARDDVHLSLVHGTIAAKLYDDAVIALTDDGVRASLRWRARHLKGTRLSLEGDRARSR